MFTLLITSLQKWLRHLWPRQPGRSWLIDRLGSLSIRVKVLVALVTLVLLSGVVILLLTRALMVRAMQTELRQHGLSIAQGVAEVCAGPVLCSDRETIDRLLRQLAERNLDLRYIIVATHDGHILAYHVSSDPIIELADVYALNAPTQSVVTFDLAGEHIWESRTATAGGEADGRVRVGMGEREMRAALAGLIRPMLASLLGMMVFSVLAAFLLTWLLTRPVVELAAAVRRLGDASYSASSHMRYQADDEIGALSQALDDAAAQLAQAAVERVAREQQRQVYLQRIIQAQEEERRRVARELHDETGQALAASMVGLRNVEEAATETEMRARLEDLRDVLAGALVHVRQLAHDLRPAVLDDLGLTPALRRYAEQYQDRFGLVVEFRAVGLDDRRLKPELETTIYRIVQEALLNAARHAHCTHVSVLLQAQNGGQPGVLSAIVEDDGRGFDYEEVCTGKDGRICLGLYGMRERAELVGGSLEVETAPGQGCAIYLRLPLADGEGSVQGREGGRDG